MKTPKSTLLVAALLLAVAAPSLGAQSCGPGDTLKPTELTFVSRETTASLIGFSELTDPSSPPKKYRRREITGTMYWGLRADGDCNPPDVSFSWERSRTHDIPYGYPYGAISWSASLTPAGTTESGLILYRAVTQIQGPEPMSLRIVVGLGNSATVSFENGEEKYLDPFSNSPPFLGVAVCPQLAGWGASLTDAWAEFVPRSSLQYRDEWQSVREYDGSDPNGTRLLADNNASVRYVSRVFAFPTAGGGEAAGAPAIATYAGLVAETLTRSRREINGTDSCVSGPGGATRVKGTYRETLSAEDTEEAAESRALVTLGNHATAFRTSRGQGFSWSSCLVTYTARFDVKCPGDYLVKVRYAVKPHDATGPGEARVVVVRRHFEVGAQTISGEVEPKEKDLDYTVESVEAQLPCGDENPGAGSFDLGSVRVRFGLGREATGVSAGALLIEADVFSAQLYTPAALLAGLPESTGIDLVRDPAGHVRQVQAPQALADVVALDASTYEVRFYAPGQVGSQAETTKIHGVVGSPFVIYRLENPDAASGGASRLRITETRGMVARVAEYGFDAAAGAWSLSTGNGLRRESELVTAVAGGRVKTRTVWNQSNEVVSKVARTYRVFPWGEELIGETLDPDGAALTTTYDYYDTVATTDPNYRRRRQRTDADGNWERYTYDGSGRVVRSVRPFLNASPLTTDEALCRVTEQVYDTVVDADGDGRAEERRTTIERTLGQETARRYEIDWSLPVVLGADTCKRRSSITCIVPGAAWEAASNLVTTTLRLASGPFAERVRRVVRPDGTATITRYDVSANGVLTTTVESGQPGVGFLGIVDGRRTVTVADAQSQIAQEQIIDIRSGLSLSSWVATQRDALGRPTRLEFDDGTLVGRSYSCCGVATERNRMGVTTTFAYDALGRVTATTRFGITTRTLYDAAGRLTSVTRVGTDGSEIIREATTYDRAGRISAQRDALGRTTTFAETFNAASGETTRTTTHPDGGTIIEISARDGSRLSIRGTAAAPHTFEYGADATGVFVTDVAVGIGSGGQPTATQWIRHYTDFAGRPLQSVFADGATSRSFYNASGQLAREVDPDGVTTLLAYNRRGEQEIRAVDLNGNAVIDFAGDDRIVRTTIGVATRMVGSVAEVVQRTLTESWETTGADTPVVIAIAEQSANGLRSWQTVRGLTTSSTTVLDGSGGCTVTTVSSEGLKTTQVFSGERLISTAVTTATDAPLSGSTFTYDSQGRRLTATDARTGTTTYAYYADDRIKTVATPDPDTNRSGPGYDPLTTTYVYDAAGRLQTVTEPDGGIVTTTYWPTGAMRRVTGARTYPVEYTYDAQGRVETLTTWQNLAADSGRAVTTWSYDPVRGFLTGKRYADGTGPTFTYQPSGRLLTRTWARTPVVTTTYSYDGAGDWWGTNYSDATPDFATTRDRAGRPGTITDGAGTRVLTYHVAGLLQDEAYTSGPLNGRAIHRSYDAWQRPDSLTVPAVLAVTYAYDAASRLATVSAGPEIASYGYLADSSRVEALTFRHGGADRLVTHRVHDRLNRVTSVTSQAGAGTGPGYAYEYNAANQRTRVTREDGSYWRHTYDGLGQVTAGGRFLAGGVPVPGHDYAWTFDDIGNRRTAMTNGPVSTYTANPLNQIARRTIPGVIDVLGAASADATVTVAVNGGAPEAVERQGDRFFRQVTVDNAVAAQLRRFTLTGVKNLAGPNAEDVVAVTATSALLPKSPEGFSHDADGNLIADGRWRYAWDAENRLVSLETAPDLVLAGASRRKLEFGYDGVGRRVEKKVSNWNGDAWLLASQTRFLYDGWNMIAELNGLTVNSVVRTYVWGLDVGGGLATAGGVGGLLWISELAGGTTHFATYDGNGNVVGLVQSGDGTWSGRYDYTAFGETVRQEGAFGAVNPFRFSTKFTDTETGLLYFGFRYYNPATGRWLNRDPIGEEGGVNVYGYVANAPTTTVDPFGLALYAFDGTNNDGYRDEASGQETNVFVLYKYYKGANSAYAPGVGTNDGVLNPLGSAFGAGGQARINGMLAKAGEFVRTGDVIADILGFSRGAAQARAFANKLKEEFPCVSIRWIGLFDTVASEGLPNDVNMGYKLGIPDGTGSVFHLTAGGERRAKTFALTSIASGPYQPNPNANYRESEVPGAAHSDVGGGYYDDRGLANYSLFMMWQDGRAHDVPFGSLPAIYSNYVGNSHDSRWINDKFVELFAGNRMRKIYYHP